MNKVETMWNIIKFETRKKVNNCDIFLSSIEGDKIDKCKIISELFNNSFFLELWRKLLTTSLIIIKSY